MITIYKLEDDFEFHIHDTWDGKFQGPLAGLDLKKDEVIKRFNTLYYRTTDDESEDKNTEKSK